MKKLLVANRGEIAIRIARAAGEIGVAALTIYAEDDGQSAHVAQGDETVALPGRGGGSQLCSIPGRPYSPDGVRRDLWFKGGPLR